MICRNLGFLIRSFLSLIFLVSTVGLLAQFPDEFFQEEVDHFSLPVGVTFDDRGFSYVWEKGGVVWLLDSNDVRLPEPFLDLSEEVAEWRDHGLLGFVLDPDFLFNGYVYCMYVVDRHHLFHFGTPQYSVDSTIINQATIGRISRFTADVATEFTRVPYDSRKVLLGETIRDGIPIPNNLHGVGSLAFGDDGSLLASTGDGGADFQEQFAADYHIFQAVDEGIVSPQEHVGPFRAQLLQGLNGKILRIDPKSGEGLSDNPYFDANEPRAAESRVWALGMRNPFRMTVIPGTGAHEIGQGDPGTIVYGDVGGAQWEEFTFLDRGGLNCGWPIYEGFTKTSWANKLRQNQYAPNPLAQSGDCEKAFFDFQDLLLPARQDDNYRWLNPCNEDQSIETSIPRFHHHWPSLDYSHKLWNALFMARTSSFDENGEQVVSQLVEPNAPVTGDNFSGFSAMAGFWYEEGNLPETYNNSFWIADYSGWIKIMKFDDELNLVRVDSFVSFDQKIVSLAFNSYNQSIYYTNVITGHLNKISYGINPPPVPVVARDTIWGNSPLSVQFDASASYHPKDIPFDFYWDFGDGETADLASPMHEFRVENGAAQSFQVRLELTDTLGKKAEKLLLVSINNSPPVVDINSVPFGNQYPISAPTFQRLAAEVTDLESPDHDLTYAWQTFLHHNAHFHPEPIDTNRQTHTLISPLGCVDELYYFRVRISVSDPQGLRTDDEVVIRPNCDANGVTYDLTAEGKENAILLSWPMEEVNNIKDVTIQKVTLPMGEWDIGTVTVDNSGSYEFEDLSPSNGMNQYRLRVNYEDGTYDYSNFVSQLFPVLRTVTVFPNPNQGIVNIYLQDINGKELRWTIYSMDGKLIQNGEFVTPDSDDSNEALDFSNFQNGAYLLEVTIGEQSHLEKILILK